MMKKLTLFLILAFSLSAYAQQYREELTEKKLHCQSFNGGQYIHFEDVLPGLYKFYVKSTVCSEAGEPIVSEATHDFADAKIILQNKLNFYKLPLKKDYSMSMPTGYYLPFIESKLLVLTFAKPGSYDYVVLEFAADHILVFETESKEKGAEDKAIKKFETATMTSLLPRAEKINPLGAAKK
ncbi:MAG: hypothetical protein ACO1N9_11235 [Flavobacterium sp.]